MDFLTKLSVNRQPTYHASFDFNFGSWSIIKIPWGLPWRLVWAQKLKLTSKTAFLTKIPVNRHPTCNISFDLNFGPLPPSWNPLGSTLWVSIDSKTKFDINNVPLTKIPISRHPTYHATTDSNFAPFLFLKSPFRLPRGDSPAPYIDEKDVFFCSNIYFSPKNVKSYNEKRKIGQFLRVVQNYHFRHHFRPPLDPPWGPKGFPRGSPRVPKNSSVIVWPGGTQRSHIWWQISSEWNTPSPFIVTVSTVHCYLSVPKIFDLQWFY